MPGAQNSRRDLFLIEESTRGTTPATPAFIKVPLAEGFMQFRQNYERSNLITGDRMGGQYIGGTREAFGSPVTPILVEDGFRRMLESALSGAFALVDLVVSVAWDSGTKTATRSAGSFLTDPAADRLEIGDKVAITGTTSNQTTLAAAVTDTVSTTFTLTSIAAFNAGGGAAKVDNEWILYTAAAAGQLTGITRGAFGTTAATHANGATIVPVREITNRTATVLTFANDTVVTEASVSTTFIANRKRLVAGITRKFFTFKQRFTDISVEENYKGEEVNTVRFSIPTSGPCQAAFEFVGVEYASGTISGQTFGNLVGSTPMAGSIPGSALIKNGVTFTGVESVEITVNNSRASKFQVGSPVAFDVEEGDFDANVTLGIYFASITEQDSFGAGTRFSLLAKTKDQDKGHEYWFELPRVLYSDGEKNPSGQTVLFRATASAEKDDVLATKMVIHERINK